MDSNYSLSPHHVIEQLQQLLQDYYPLGPDGRTFLKELIQNADDAGATALRFFVLEEGYPDAENSLLRGPALLYINDGAFGADDERGLTSFVGGSKSADDEKVGRFGLGQKVVFHFSEAWCYLGRGPASTGREGGDRPPTEERARVINPWSGTGRGPGDPQHPDWDDLTPTDRSRLRDAVEPKAGGASFLAVWLPLRRKGHRRKSGAALSELEPSTTDVLERLCNGEQVARLLSACRSLSSVEVRASRDPTAEGERRLLACREQGAYLGRYSSTAPARERELDGVVEVASPAGTRMWTVTGLEVLSNHPQVLAELRSDSWPLRNVWSRDDGDAIRERVKAAPHAAVTALVGKAERGRGRVAARWAVFFPVDDLAFERDLPEAGVSLEIFVHGYFWPRSDRRDIPGVTSPEEGGGSLTSSAARERWNVVLRDLGALPLFLGAVERALALLDPNEVDELVAGIYELDFFKRNRAVICRDHGLIPVFDGHEARWARVPIQRRRLPVPVRTDMPRVVRLALASVVEACGGVLVDRNGARLDAESSSAGWTVSELEALLRSSELAAAESPEVIESLTSVLTTIRGDIDGPDFEHALRGFVGRVVAGRGTRHLVVAAVRGSWSRLVGLLPRSGLLFVGSQENAGKAIDSIAKAGLLDGFLILPGGLDNSSESGDKTPLSDPSFASVAEILRFLGEAIAAGTGAGDTSIESFIFVAEKLIERVGFTRVADDPRLAGLPLIRVRSTRSDAFRPVRFEELRGAARRKRAFSGTDVARDVPLGKHLAAALDGAEDDVLLVQAPTTAAELKLPRLDAEGVAAALLVTATRISPDRRRREPVLSALVERTGTAKAASAEVRHAMRFLLHGSDRNRDEGGPLYAAAGSGADAAALACLLDAGNEGWRALPKGALEHLTPAWQTVLEVRSSGRDEITRLAGNLGDDERRRLRTSPHADALLDYFAGTEFFDRLPLHRTPGGDRIEREDGRTFVESDWPVPAALSGRVELVQVPARLRSAYEAWPAFDRAAQRRLVLGSDSPHRMAELVLDAVEDGQQLDEEFGSKEWLRDAAGRPTAPGDILQLPDELDRLVERLLAAGSALTFRVPSQLDVALREHRSTRAIIDQFALSGSDAIEALAMQLEDLRADPTGAGDVSGWLVGPAGAPPQLLATGLKCSALGSHPGWELLRAARRVLEADEDSSLTTLYRGLCGPYPSDRLAKDLVDVGDAAENAPASDRGAVETFFKAYLSMAVKTDEFFTTHVGRLRLPAADESWRRTDELARHGASLEPTYRLREDIAKLIEPLLAAVGDGDASVPRPGLPSSSVSPPTAQHHGAAIGIVEAYCSPWRARVNDVAIGTLLAALGDGPDGRMGRVAAALLGTSASVEGTRKAILRLAYGDRSDASDVARIANARYGVRVVAGGDRVDVASIAGAPLRARTSGGHGDAPSLLVQPVGPCGRDSNRWLVLRRVDVHAVPQLELQRLLFATIEAILEATLERAVGPGFGGGWLQKYGDGSQVEIGPVRDRIIDELPAQLRPLDVRQHEGLRTALATFDAQDTKWREAKLNREPMHTVHERDLARSAALDGIRALIEEDESARSHVLGRVRKKMGEFQYHPRSVLLELFQNADDAVSQLREMRHGELPAEVCEVLVEVHRDDRDGMSGSSSTSEAGSEAAAAEPLGSTARLLFRHWGRPINMAGGASFPEGRRRGYDRDLLNMMLLNVSTKPGESAGELEVPEGEATTGRFGLGFKSVHLVTSQPRVASGWISLEIRGGLLPRVWSPPAEWADARRGDASPTTIELPLDRPELGPEMVDSLLESAPLLPVFARALRKLTVSRSDGEQSFEWRPRLLDGVPTLEIGDARGNGTIEPGRWLCFRPSEGSGALAMRLYRGELKGLPDNVPTLFATAPTEERWHLGYAVQGPLSLDVGRSRVDITGAETISLFRRLGATLGETLVTLYDRLDARWAAVAPELGLPVEDPDRKARIAFWRSVWDVLSRGLGPRDEPNRRRLLCELHGSGRGLSRLVTERATIPTGLPAPFDAPTSLEKLRFSAAAELRDGEIARALASHPALLRFLPVHSVVDEPSAGIVRCLFEKSLRPRGLIEVLQDWAREAGVDLSVDGAHMLSFVGRLDAKVHPALRERAVRWAADLRFRATDGAFHEAHQLLLPRMEEANLVFDESDPPRDEMRRAEFAPAHVVLHGEYSSTDALQFFLFARAKRRVGGPEELANWARDCADVGRRVAALRYLLEGVERANVAEAIRRQGGLPWLPAAPQLAEPPWSDHFGEDQLRDLVTALFPPATLARALGRGTSGDAAGDGHICPGCGEWVVVRFYNGMVRPLGCRCPRDGFPLRLSEQEATAFLEEVHAWWSTPGVRERHLVRWTEAWYPRPENDVALAASLRGERGADAERRAWLTLFFLGLCQTLGRSHPRQHRGFLEHLQTSGRPYHWDRLFRRDSGAEDWFGFLETWAESRSSSSKYGWWMRLLPEMFQAWRWLDDYRHVFCTLDRRPERSLDVESFLAPNEDAQQGGGGVNVPAFLALKGGGAAWVIRELSRLGVLRQTPLVEANGYARRGSFDGLLDWLGCPPSDGNWSENAHAFLARRLGLERARFGGDLDIPLLLVSVSHDLRDKAREGTLAAEATDDFFPDSGEVEDPEAEIDGVRHDVLVARIERLLP